MDKMLLKRKLPKRLQYAYMLYTLYVYTHLHERFYSACVSAGTPLLTMLAPSITNPKGLIFNVKVTPNPHTFMVFINEKQELSLRGCLDYEV